MWVCVSVWGYVHKDTGHQIFLELVWQAIVSCLMWVLCKNGRHFEARSHLSSPCHFQGGNTDPIHPGTSSEEASPCFVFLSPVSTLRCSQMRSRSPPTQERSQGWQGCSEKGSSYPHRQQVHTGRGHSHYLGLARCCLQSEHGKQGGL